MARKKSQKEKVIVDTEKVGLQEEVKLTPMNIGYWKWVVLLFGFLLYVNTVKFDYALDDKIVIMANQLTKQGFEGAFSHFFYDSMDGFWAEQYGLDIADLEKEALVAGGRYRPLSLFSYALEWEFFGENPGVSHFINACLYGLTGWFLIQLLIQLIPPKAEIWKSVAFWVTLVFLSHPLHVEVVANIKSRDEILSLLFGILTVQFLLRYVSSSNKIDLLKSGILLFLSLMSKETTIAFVAVGPLMLYFFNKGNAKVWKESFIALFLAGLLYTVIRFMIIGSSDSEVVSELMNSPFLNASEGERIATIFLILAAYVKLLVFPFPLTHDYYPYHLPFLPEDMSYASWSSLPAILGVVLIMGMMYVIVKGFKSKGIYAFSALVFLATSILVSNLFFPIGVFMNERFMYVPSLAFALVLVYFLLEDLPAKWQVFKSTWGMYFLVLTVGVFSVMSVKRSLAWESDSTLALTDVKVSLGSAKAKMAAADAILQELPQVRNQNERQEMISEAYQHLSKSLEIYPEYFPPLDLLGKLYYESGNYTESVKFYAFCVARKPNESKFVENIFIIGNKMVAEGLYQDAFYAYEKALSYSPNEKRYLMAIAQVSAKDLNNPSQGLPFMQKAYSLYSDDRDVAEKMAITYAMLGRFQDAIDILLPLYQLNPNSATVVRNLGI
ncbi:MAG: tetratricopeptide (TPR) repeat protein, partial [Halieaceae bacterium]